MKIAVDGPSGSGKSTISKAIAEKYELAYLDTGAMYRAVTAWLLAGREDLSKNWNIDLKRADLKINTDPKNFTILIADKDVTLEIRTQRITDSVSQVSAHPGVRDWMVALQREIMEQSHGIVMEGRDIGTVVMPDADVKIFIEADIEKRAARRALEMATNSTKTQESLRNRDKMDSSRAVSPLVRAVDAVLVDTSELDIDESIAAVIRIIEKSLPNE